MSYSASAQDDEETNGQVDDYSLRNAEDEIDESWPIEDRESATVVEDSNADGDADDDVVVHR